MTRKSLRSTIDDESNVCRTCDARWLKRFRRNLRLWYRKHARTLPWRQTADPYQIWVSEIMLQQTTVAAVVPFFERFVQRFHSIGELAAAPESEVLKYWEGLGYYSRARNLHRAARTVLEKFQGQLPDDAQALQQLSGIGRYTAGAIVSFAFDQRAPIVEANTLRLYCRLIGYRGDPRASAGQQLLWNFAEQLVPRNSPGLFNQALMELGAQVCSLSVPDCKACPVRSCCRAFQQGIQQEIPIPPPRTKTLHVTEAAVAVQRKRSFLLYRRAPGERWAGLWDFPRFPIDDAAHFVESKRQSPRPKNGRTTRQHNRLRAHLGREVQKTYGIDVSIDEILTEIRHSVTRYRIRLLCYRAQCLSSTATKVPAGAVWISRSKLSDYPLSVTGRKIAEILANL